MRAFIIFTYLFVVAVIYYHLWKLWQLNKLAVIAPVGVIIGLVWYEVRRARKI